MHERDAANLWDMLDAARRAMLYTSGKRYADLESDRMLRDAIERLLEIIGEGARRVSPQFREEHPEVPWARIIAQRNVISHEYGEIKLEWIWLVVTERLPELIVLLEPLIPPLPEE